MAVKTIVISNILQGHSPAYYFGQDGSYLSSIGIDPDFPDTGSAIRTSGILNPVGYSVFSTSTVSAAPLWLETTPKNSTVYTYLADGKIVSYSSSFGSETAERSVSSSSGNGCAYYNNYLYYARNTDIGRYGPLDNSPSFTDGAWTGATLGSQTALANTTYPTIRGVGLPNHPMHVHSDGALYVADVVAGQGVLHKIVTKKVTNEGDTNNGSLYNVIDLPFGFIPTAIKSYGTDIVIAAIQTTNATITQGNAMLFFWDSVSPSFYRQVLLPDPLVTALLNNNGVLYIWSGNNSNGVRMSAYAGGESIQTLTYQEEGMPPFPGAVAGLGDRVAWGGFTTYPTASASVFAYGSKDARLPKGVANIIKTTSAGATPFVTALKYIQQSSFITPKLVPGWHDGTTQGLDQYSASATLSSVWRSQVFNVGAGFQVKRIRLPLGKAVAANMSIVPKVYVDEESSSVTLDTISTTLYPSSERAVVQYPRGVNGKNNFFLELTWGSTVALPVAMPIVIDIETKEE